MRWYFFFFLLIPTLPVQLAAKHKIYITLNPAECTNCLNQAEYINKLNSDYQKIFVFEKRYRTDSAFLRERFFIEPEDHVIWSDSLYRVFKKDGDKGGYYSSVSLLNEENGAIIKTYLVNFSYNLHFFNTLNKPADTLVFEHELFSGNMLMIQDGTSFFCYNILTGTLSEFSRTNYRHRYDYNVTDSLVINAYRLRYGAEWEQKYTPVTGYFKAHRRVGQNKIKAFFPKGDTVYTLVEHAYLFYTKFDPRQPKMDSNVSVFLTLNTYVNGKIVHQGVVENYLSDDFQGFNRGIRKIYLHQEAGPNAYYVLLNDNFFVTDQGQVYLSIIGPYAKGDLNNFLAIYEADSKGNYAFSKLYGGSLPSIYDGEGYNYNFAMPIAYHYPYTSTFLSDHLFSIDSSGQDIEMGYFDKIGKIKFPRRELGVWSIKVDKQYVYMVYMNKETKYYHYLKWDRATQQAVIDKKIQRFDDPSTFIAAPVLDDFDYNYVYIPLSENSILRKKFGE